MTIKHEYLIRWLRVFAKGDWIGHENQVLSVKAAATIEELLAENHRLQEEFQEHLRCDEIWEGSYEKLKAQNRRLREALEEIEEDAVEINSAAIATLALQREDAP